MKISIFKGRLGNHRFHSMLVHFPSALYPFSLVMDCIACATSNHAFSDAGRYALTGALVMSVVAMVYGANDFLQIDSKNKAWKTAGLHALLNVSWFIVYCSLLFYRIKHEDAACSWIYLGITAVTMLGLFSSNYLGADLIIKYRITDDR